MELQDALLVSFLGYMVVFIGLVFVAYVYVWRKGGLDWERGERTPIEVEQGATSEREAVHAR